jgi:hypothetical protein
MNSCKWELTPRKHPNLGNDKTPGRGHFRRRETPIDGERFREAPGSMNGKCSLAGGNIYGNHRETLTRPYRETPTTPKGWGFPGVSVHSGNAGMNVNHWGHCG